MTISTDRGPDEWDQEDWEKFKEWYKGQQKKREEKRSRRRELREQSEFLSEEVLRSHLQRSFPGFYWRLEDKPPEMGRQQVDILGTPSQSDYFVFIEVERNRPTAIYNVVKAWQYVETNVKSKPVLLIQIFSPYHYSTGDTKRRLKQAIFIGQQAEKANKKLTYRYLDEGYWPTKKDEEPIKMGSKISSLISDYEKAG